MTLPSEGAGQPAGAGATMALFALPQLALAAVAMPVVIYLPQLYASFVGIPLATVGVIFMAIRLLDMAIDPVLGVLMDRTRSRWGRFRPWMAASVPLLMLAAVLAFMPPQDASIGYLIASLLLLYAAYSIAFVGHLAWGSVLVTSYAARSRLYGWIQALTMVGMVLILCLPPIVAHSYPDDQVAIVHAIGWFLVVAAPLAILPVIAAYREPARRVAVAGRSRASIGEVWRVVSRPAVARILGCAMFLALAPGLTGALFIFFFKARGFTPPQASLLLLFYFLGALLGTPVWPALAARIGKHRAMITSSLYFAAAQASVVLVGRGDMVMGVVVIGLTGVGYSAAFVLLRSMIADACDEARLDTGDDRAGMLYALYSSIAKVGVAAAVGISYPVLAWVGFTAKPDAHNPPAAVAGLVALYIVAPIVFKIGGALCLVGYRLDERRHRAIRDELARRETADLPPFAVAAAAGSDMALE